MEGSDDEFSDLGEVEEDEQDDTFVYILEPQVLVLLEPTPLLLHRVLLQPIKIPTRQLTLTAVPHGLPPSILSPSRHSHLQLVQPFPSLHPQ